MSSMMQTMREEFAAGDEVLVERRQYNGRQSVHRGKIEELYESSALVRLIGVNGRSRERVPYKRMQHVPPAPEQTGKLPPEEIVLRAVPNAFARVQPQQEEQPMPTPAEQLKLNRHSAPPQPITKPAPTPPPSSPPPSSPVHSDLATWLDMGRGILDQLRAKASVLRADSERLAREAEQLADQADAKLAEAEQIEQDLKLDMNALVQRLLQGKQ